MTPKFICLINSPHLLYLGFLTSYGCLPPANRFAPPSYVVYNSMFVIIMHFIFCEKTLLFSEYWLQNIKLHRVSLVGRNKKKSRRQSLLRFVIIIGRMVYQKLQPVKEICYQEGTEKDWEAVCWDSLDIPSSSIFFFLHPFVASSTEESP